MVEDLLEAITKLMRVVNEFFFKFQVYFNFWRVWVQKTYWGQNRMKIHCLGLF